MSPGNRAYFPQFLAAAKKRANMVDSMNQLTNAKASHSRYASVAAGDLQLIDMIPELPPAPKEVEAAQDKYLDTLIDEQ